MRRCFVYVNKPTKKVNIHLERKGPCQHVGKHIRKFGAYSKSGHLQIKIFKNGTIKIEGHAKSGKKSNDYWLILWIGANQRITTKPSVKNAKRFAGADDITLCQHCS